MPLPTPMVTLPKVTLYGYLAACAVVGILAGFYLVDAVGFSMSSERRLQFVVTPDGKVIKDSEWINRFFHGKNYNDKKVEELPADRRHVFGYPFDENSKDPYRCWYESGGIAFYKDFPSPPVPPCPQ